MFNSSPLRQQLNDFNGLMAVLSGLNNVAVQRLRYVWKEIPNKKRHVFDSLEEMMSTLNGMKQSEEARSEDELVVMMMMYQVRGQELVDIFSDPIVPLCVGYKNYKIAIHSRPRPVLPYIALTLRDVLYIKDGNKAYLSSPKSYLSNLHEDSPGGKKEKVLNFKRMQLLSKTISEVREILDILF
tara:strand:+ start:120 stop:671 length:552 start_codon:yes stop_codon:yes gene_type:complete